jgi:prepilin-type N-terminal cleavage/methylation domain-containing protein
MTVSTQTACHAGNRAPSRGFTLTEIAIVLGIIGLILGAIWVAAAAVYNNMRVSTANTELLQISQAVRAMYATSSMVDPGADMTISGANSGGGLTYLHAGVFPTSALNTATPSTATQAYNPWNGSIAIAHGNYPGGIADDSFAVAFDAIPSQACITLLTSSTGQGRDPGMWAALGNAAGTAISPSPGSTLTPGTPLPASTAEGQCANADNGGIPGNQAVFYFTLRAGTS